MSVQSNTPSPRRFVVLQEVAAGQWRFLGEVDRKPGLTAQAARTRAILEATDGKAKRGERYAAVLRSEWHISQSERHISQKWNVPDQ